MNSLAQLPKIALIGPYPPPYGGVSIHIKRLFYRLKQVGYAPRVYCQKLAADRIEEGIVPTTGRFTWKWWLLEQSWRPQPSLIHCHDGWYWTFDMWLMCVRGKRIVMTIHDQMTQGKFAASPEICKLSARLLMRSSRVEWIAVSQAVQSQLFVLGVPQERVNVIPAFLPPENGCNGSKLPDALSQFTTIRRPLLVTYGWRLWLDTNQQDVYGFDLCLELTRKLKPEFPNIGLVILLPQIGEPYYLAELQRRVREYGLVSNVLIWLEPLDEPYQLWKLADVFLRATNTDGDAVSVREALGLYVPVVASDASPRPEGTHLFPSRDLDAFVRSTHFVLHHRDECIHNLRYLNHADNLDNLLSVYQRMYSK